MLNLPLKSSQEPRVPRFYSFAEATLLKHLSSFFFHNMQIRGCILVRIGCLIKYTCLLFQKKSDVRDASTCARAWIRIWLSHLNSEQPVE